MTARIGSSCLAATILAGCIGRGIPYEGGGPPEPAGDGYAIEGRATDLDSGGLPPPGLCATAIDPAPAVVGGDPTLLASAPLEIDGTFSVPGITENPAVGMFIGIDDCEDSGADVVMNAATGIGAEEIEGKGAGDVVGDVEAVVVTHDLEGRWATDVGWTGVLGEDGFLAGFVLDAERAPVGGATVTGGGATTYYADADPSDGIFGVGATFNTATDPAAGALFLIPGAPISTYSADDGGAHTWDPALFGSVPGIGAFIDFDAAP